MTPSQHQICRGGRQSPPYFILLLPGIFNMTSTSLDGNCATVCGKNKHGRDYNKQPKFEQEINESRMVDVLIAVGKPGLESEKKALH